MPHFFIKSKNIKDNLIIVDDKDLYKHIIKVMRAKRNEKLLFLDENEIQYETVINDIEASCFSAEILKSYKSNRKLNLNLYIAQSVLNSDAQVSSIQKATELGVKGIIPLYPDNCSIKKSVIETKIEKWQKTVLESVKQCERADVPKVYEMSDIKSVISKYNQVFVFAEKYTDKTFFEYLKTNKIDKNKDILVIIGPEGGFSHEEARLALDYDFELVSLGRRILRAETAAIYAASILSASSERE